MPVTASALAHFLTAMITITTAAWALGRLAPRFGQPVVMGEVLAGLLLGPSFLGLISPAAAAVLLPKDALPAIGMMAQLGVTYFMFAIGLELDFDLLRKNSTRVPIIAAAGIALPFVLGLAIAPSLFRIYAPTGGTLLVFSLFIGISLAITAFPVLVRILKDTGRAETPVGATAIVCAALGDVAAWCLLAAVACLAQNGRTGGATPALFAAGTTLLYASVIWFGARPLLAKWCAHQDLTGSEPNAATGRDRLLLVAALALSSALVTELIGIHAIFGAFLLGAAFPRRAKLTKALHAPFAETVAGLFLPLFFAYTGTRTSIGALSSKTDWLVLAAIIVLATAGKFGGTYAAARATGQKRADAAALGVLMNTRGLVELIALNLGLDLGIISPKLFTMLVLMALVTTFATSPLLQLVNYVAAARRKVASRLKTEMAS